MHELAQQQRVTARLLVAGGAERIVGGGREGLSQERGGGLDAQRRGPDHGRERVRDDLVEQPGIFTRLARPEPDDDRKGKTLDARQQIGQPAHRRKIAPVQVVDREQQRPLSGEVRRQPVEPMQRRQRCVGPGLGLELLGVEERFRQCRRPGERFGSLFLGQGGEQRLEELAHDAERERPLELRASPAEHPHPGLVAPGLDLRHQRALADPGRPFDCQQHATGVAGSNNVLEGCQLGVSLQQVELLKSLHRLLLARV